MLIKPHVFTGPDLPSNALTHDRHWWNKLPFVQRITQWFAHRKELNNVENEWEISRKNERMARLALPSHADHPESRKALDRPD